MLCKNNVIFLCIILKDIKVRKNKTKLGFKLNYYIYKINKVVTQK